MKAGEQLSVIIETDPQQAEHKQFLRTLADGQRLVNEGAQKEHQMNTSVQQPPPAVDKEKIKEAIKAKLTADNSQSNGNRM